jgi:uncharacterized tellurite resistance protein B-like protein
MIIHNTLEDFILFLYIHMSHADNNYDPAELTAIEDKMRSLYPEEQDIERKLYNALRDYNNIEKTSLHRILSDTFIHYSKEHSARLIEVINDLMEITKADGKIDQDEERMLNGFKDLIHNAS